MILHCEYSKAQHKIEIEPNTPSRNRDLFATLLEKRLENLDLLNPVRDFEMHIVPCPEKEGQLDFFEPRVSDSDKLQTLFSLLLQSGVKPGLYEIEPAILPERGWQLVSDLERQKISRKDSDALTSKAKGDGLEDTDVVSVASAPEYGINIAYAPDRHGSYVRRFRSRSKRCKDSKFFHTTLSSVSKMRGGRRGKGTE